MPAAKTLLWNVVDVAVSRGAGALWTDCCNDVGEPGNNQCHKVLLRKVVGSHLALETDIEGLLGEENYFSIR